MVKTIIGDLLEAKEQYIAHQCNCVSKGSAGLAYFLFKQFPYANIYQMRTSHSIPGTIHIAGDGIDNRYVINMFSQYYPGHYFDYYTNDNYDIRKHYFYKCLTNIANISNINSIAFPYKIGCGIAGGDWEDYLKMINDFADNNTNIAVVIYQRESDL